MTNKCCGSCAFLKCNAGKPNPDPTTLNDPAMSCENWYTQQNIDRIWNLTRQKGNFLTCHSTDPSYYGKKEKQMTACLGFTLAVFMHIKIFELIGSFQKYRQAVGYKVAMDRGAMFEAAISMSMGRADLFGKMKIINEISESRPMLFPTGFEKTLSKFQELTGLKVPV